MSLIHRNLAKRINRAGDFNTEWGISPPPGLPQIQKAEFGGGEWDGSPLTIFKELNLEEEKLSHPPILLL
jgi:hypothetical protein